MSETQRDLLIQQATRAIKWSALGQLVPRMITPLSTLILAYILVPADFGAVAVANLVLNLALVVISLGLGQAVVQRSTETHEAASVAFWTNMVIAVVMYAILFLAAPQIEQAYDIPRSGAAIRVSGLALIMQGATSIPMALLRRDLKFHTLFWVQSMPQIMAAFVSVLWAIIFGGMWALVIGPLAGIAVNTIMIWIKSTWRPMLYMDPRLLFELLRFSAWVTVAALRTWVFLYADNAIAGFFLGADDMGVYTLGFNIATLAPGMLLTALSTVAYPTFCKLASPQEVGTSLLKLQSIIAAVIFPLGFGLSAIAVPLFALMYGSKWDGLGSVVVFIAILPGLGHLWSLSADAYRAIGRPDVWAKVSIVSMLVLLPLLIVAGSYGLLPYAFARFLGTTTTPILSIYLSARFLNLKFVDQVASLGVPTVCASFMYIVVFLGVYLLAPFTGLEGWLKLFFLIALGAAVYLGLFHTLDRRLWAQVFRSFHRVVFSH